MDNHATEHAYPRLKDPSNGKWLVISDATTNTFKVNVGQAGASQTYTPTAATYTAATGQLVLTVCDKKNETSNSYEVPVSYTHLTLPTSDLV